MIERSITLETGKTYTLDRYGFLDPPAQWDKDFAIEMAKRVGVAGDMTEEHWSFIRYLRSKFLEEKTVPVVVLACADNKLRLGKLRTLFPAGYHRGACKVAGINYDFMYKHNIWLTYESYRMLKANYEMTPMGFLKDFDRWDRQFAVLIASDWNLPNGLSDDHWRVICYVRDRFKESKDIPIVYETIRDLELTLGKLLDLFSEGYRRGVCRAAGLPFFP
ncbi:MAG: TusE/DsrC/DsvC family sulfur relay protein [Candidatus Latescibacterota bacterium]|nr:MAG: TusE/DsrC/DsvC family sulfur relay protein [Candidatus Latescibacterota bacterium]